MALREKLQLRLTARNDARAAFAQLERQLNGLRGKLVGMKGVIAGAFGVGSILSFAGALEGAKRAMEELDMVAKRARTFGLSSDFYQMLQVAAEEAGVAQSTLNASLTAFAKRVGEARAGTGPLAASLKKIDAALYEAIRNSRSQEEALRILADRMRMTSSASDRAALASAAFSRAGVDMVRILRQGADVFDTTMAKARDMGLIIDRELLERAESLQNEYGLATRVLDLQFKQILIELAPIITRVAQGVASFVRAVRGMLEDDLLPKDRRLLALIRKEIASTEQQIARMRENMQFGEAAAGAERLAMLHERLSRLRHELRQVSSGKTDMLEIKAPTMPAAPPPLPDARKERSGTARQNAFSAELASLRERISMLRLEQQLVGRSAEAAERLRITHQLLAAARRAGIPITDAVKQQVGELAATYVAENAQLERLRQSQQRLRQAEEEAFEALRRRREEQKRQLEAISSTLSNSISSAVESWMSGTAKITDAMRQMAQQLIQMAMRTMLNRAVQQLFGNLFQAAGPGIGALLGFSRGGVLTTGRVQAFAAGGVVGSPTLFPMARGLGLMGEAGPEAILPLKRGADGRLGVAASGGQPVQITMNITTPDAEGFRRNRGRITAELARAMAEGQRNL